MKSKEEIEADYQLNKILEDLTPEIQKLRDDIQGQRCLMDFFYSAVDQNIDDLQIAKVEESK